MKKSPAALLVVLMLTLFFPACKTVVPAVKAESYYVSARGSDRNDGISMQTPFRSMFKALSAASKSETRVITVIGTLNVESEQSSSPDRVFVIQGTGKELLTIRGIPGSGDDSRAVLSGAGTATRVILVRGVCNILFKDIEISGGSSRGEGGGIGIGKGALVELGPGTVLRSNRAETVGGGAALAPGAQLLISGALVSDNSCLAVGGGIAAAGKGTVIAMKSGEISNNRAEGGGGVAVFEGGSFLLSGGKIEANHATIAGGGVVLNVDSSFIMEGGEILHNSASGSGGGVALIRNCRFSMHGGGVSGNTSGDSGGGIGGDDTSVIELLSGTVGANEASRGGGVFSAHSFAKAAGMGALLYGVDGGENANKAGEGAAAYIFRSSAPSLREKSAGDNDGLDSDLEGSDGGWDDVPEESVMEGTAPEEPGGETDGTQEVSE